MKAKHIYSAVLLSMLAVGCTNDDFSSIQNGAVEGKMMDASNFVLVEKAGEDVQTRVNYIPGYFAGGTVMQFVTPTWEADDVIGFSHIYPSDQRLVTNYKFEIDPADAGKATGATFTTDNSTIFEGEYFVYYPFNADYHKYGGIPFELSNIQTQDATTDATVNMSMDPETDAAALEKFKKAGKHLVKFSISNRVQAEEAVSQTEFSFNQYTSQICFLLFPKNQSNAINVKRIELVSSTDEPLKVPTKVLFNSQGAGVAAPAAEIDKASCADRAVLLFENVNATTGAGGLNVPSTTTSKDAVMGYISMIPTTYAQGTYKFVVYYTEDADKESNSLKRVEITKNGALELKSNVVQPVSLEIDAQYATEITTDYDIYNETEFASAVAKSNQKTSGSSEFNLANDIELKNDYTLSSRVPLTFTGGKTLKVISGKTLTLNSPSTITIKNTIMGAGKMDVKQGEVKIASINDAHLELVNAGTLVVENAEEPGNVKYVSNTGNLTLNNAVVADAIGVHNANGTVNLKDVTVNKTMTFNEEVVAASTLENVEVKGNVTNNAAKLTVKGENTLAYNAVTGTLATLINAGEINFVEGATATIGNLAGKIGSVGKINLGREATPSEVKVTVEGESDISQQLVYVDTKATFTANDELKGLKSNGHDTDPSKTTMILEGTLETAGAVKYNKNFSFCGKVVNKAGGNWVVNNAAKLSRFIHTHNNTPATFINEAGGVVTVNDVEDVNATVAMNALPKDLYDATSEGTLIWRDITSMQNVDDIYNLGEDCWATQLEADLTIPNRDVTGANETFVNGVDWSNKDIVLNILTNSTGAQRGYKVEVGSDKQIVARSLTVNARIANGAKTQSMTVEGGTTGAAIAVSNTLSLNNYTVGTFNLTIENGATCKDMMVTNVDNGTFVIYKGSSIHYTGTYSWSGNSDGISYPNNMPQKQ